MLQTEVPPPHFSRCTAPPGINLEHDKAHFSTNDISLHCTVGGEGPAALPALLVVEADPLFPQHSRACLRRSDESEV